MAVEITARHMHATSGLQEYARTKGETVCTDFTRVEHVHVILDVQKHLHIAEVVVQAKSHIRVEALEQTDNMRASIDAAFDKVEKQLRRLRDKLQEHHRVKTPEEVE